MKKLLLIGLIGMTFSVFAQDRDPIVTDRPTQSAAVNTVGKNSLLIESGFIHEAVTDFVNVNSFNTLLRYGIGEKVELRFSGILNKPENESLDLGNASLGAKVHILDKEEAFINMSIIGQINLPINEVNDELSSELRLNFQNQLSDRLGLSYNLGTVISEQFEDFTPFYTLSFGFLINEEFSVFAEPYGFFLDDESDHRFNTGLIYLIKNNLQFDISGGVGLSEISPDYFLGFGAAIGF